MNLGELFTQTLFGMGKDQYGGYVTPANFPEAINYHVQPDVMNAFAKKFEESRVLSNDVRPFIKTLGDPANPPLPLVKWSPLSPFSYGQFPTDFWYFSDAYYSEFFNSCNELSTVQYRSVEWVDRARFNYLTSTKLLFPDVAEPIASTQNDQIVACPALTSLTFTYLRQPSLVIFDYEILTGNTVSYLPPGSVHTNATTAPVGTPSTSVELEWPQSMYDEFLRRLIQWYGQNIQDQMDMSMPSKKP